jgi:S-adenosylmethionine hydrolase
MSRPIITFTTDFGLGSPYVAEMKGAALSICPDATLIDLTHAVPPQNVRLGAIYLAQAAPSFPPGSIHVGVVDPGVGTSRKIVVARSQGRYFVVPDNGLLSRVIQQNDLDYAVEANDKRFWRQEVSSTFHGRDIMTVLAAHLANGVAIDALGPKCERLVELDFPQPSITRDRLVGEVMAIDSFGNLISNVNASQLGNLAITSARCAGAAGMPTVQAYAERAEGEFVSLIGSSGWLEIAQVGGNAARELNVEVGEPIYFECR